MERGGEAKSLAVVKVRRRPDFTLAVRALISHVAGMDPHFAHVDARRILVVSGEARRASRGTVKPLTFAAKKRTDSLGRKKPLVRVHGRQMLYCITLRPLFFRKSTTRQRVATVLHELFHISKHFDGTLDHQRRHEEAGEGFEAEFAPIERRIWKQLPPELIAPFGYDGEVRILQWLEKPQSWLPGERASHRHLYTEKHLFEGVVRMKARGPKGASPKTVH